MAINKYYDSDCNAALSTARPLPLSAWLPGPRSFREPGRGGVNVVVGLLQGALPTGRKASGVQLP